MILANTVRRGRDREGVDLTGDPHGAQLRAYSRPASGRHHDAGDDGSEFPHHGHGHQSGNIVGGSEPTKDFQTLHGQDHPQGEGRDQHQGQGLDPQMVHLGDGFPEKPGGENQAAASLNEKDAHIPHVIQKGHHLMSSQGKQADFWRCVFFHQCPSQRDNRVQHYYPLAALTALSKFSLKFTIILIQWSVKGKAPRHLRGIS
jgi:hypothetical protein